MIFRLRVEEDSRGFEKNNPNEANANFVEHGQSSKFKEANNKGKDTMLGPKEGVSKKLMFQEKCFNCGK